jgi:hypothetical protein
VPAAGLSCGGEDGPVPTALQAASPTAATNNNARSNCGTRRCTRPPEARRQNPARTNAIPARNNTDKARWEPCGKLTVEAAMCGAVVMASVTVCFVAPGVIVADGAKEAVAPAGSGDTLNVTGSENVPFEGNRVNGRGRTRRRHRIIRHCEADHPRRPAAGRWVRDSDIQCPTLRQIAGH